MSSLVRAAAQAERARQQALNREAASARRAFREAERQAKADARQAASHYLIGQMEEAEALTREIHDREQAIETLLARALAVSPAVDLEAQVKTFSRGKFDETAWPSVSPDKASFAPPAPGFFARLVPGAARRHSQKICEAESQHRKAQATFDDARRRRNVAFTAFQNAEEKRKAELDKQNAVVRDLERGLQVAEHASVLSYFQAVIEASLKGEPDAISAGLGYSPDSKHLVVDLDLPDLSVIPDEVGFKYVKSADRIDSIPRAAAKRKASYARLICEIILKCIDTTFRGGAPIGVIDCLTVNGMLDTIDPTTGQDIRICLVSVRVTTDTFNRLNLAQVQPEQCLRSLKASISRAPAELLPVKPLVELNMVDPRFIDSTDVMSTLDHRPNLMELSPNEFEGLITNLFAAMGLDTRQTQPSRDGGVDCVAFDSRPIFGGKVVIQAKRYKNTVGVSAVRDLFGTVQNEGASKGILVTTSGYGKAAYDFATGKPLELLDGGNLLHLLAEHAGVEARIIAPENWVDIPLHGE